MKDLPHPYSQKATITKLTEHSAFLTLPDGQEIEWDKSLLPKDIKTSQDISLIIHDKAQDQVERNKLAKEILNELFTPEASK